LGIDEVGRGAWAGPLVIAAVSLPEVFKVPGIRDSKFLSPLARERLAPRIREVAAVGIGLVPASELSDRGMAWALGEGARRAIHGSGLRPGTVLLDGHHDYLGGAFPCETIVGGDRTELCIAAASVVAKAYRDQLMVEYDQQYPGYGFAAHKGYGTLAHRQAIAEFGPCDLHRTGWKPFASLVK
jgi:ribonuclease HII